MNGSEISAETAMVLLGSGDFKDAPYWDVLAATTEYRLPPWDLPCTETNMVLWLERFGETPDMFNRRTGLSVKEFIDRNKKWPLRAFVGLLLENSKE